MREDVWLAPDQFNLPGRWGRQVRLLVNFGAGDFEMTGTAFLLSNGSVVFSDEGGWCTPYVKKFRWLTRDELEAMPDNVRK